MILRPLFGLAIVVASALPAQAQDLLGPLAEPRETQIRKALATDYVQPLLKTFVASVRKAGDPVCLQSKAFDDPAIAERGRALWQRYGVQMMKVMDENFDQKAYESALEAEAGRGALAEIIRLKQDDGVRKLIEVNRIARQAKQVDTILENFDRYVLVARIKLDAISAIARGEQPDESLQREAEAAAEKFIEQNPSPQIDRYFELLDAVDAAAPKAYARNASKLSPMVFFAGADRDLAELCIGKR